MRGPGAGGGRNRWRLGGLVGAGLVCEVARCASLPAAAEDVAWAARRFADQGVALREQCRTRWGMDEASCQGRWAQWVEVQAREAARERHRRAHATSDVVVPAMRLRAATGKKNDQEPRSYAPVASLSGPAPEEGVILAVGVVSACEHYAHRAAIRATWLGASRGGETEGVAHRFFVAATSQGLAPGRLVSEAARYRDLAVMNWTESYGSTLHKVVAIFRWGVRECRAHYVLRANDDVYLRLEPTLAALYRAGPPVRVYGGLFLSGFSAPRLEALASHAEAELKAAKAWTVSRAEYPADAYPVFAQGNAYVLSRDMADRVADLVDRPWLLPSIPDDVLVGLVVDSMHGVHGFRRLDLPADYALEGAWTPCSDAALWHFNLHPEHMYDLHLAEPHARARVVDLDLDGRALALAVSDADNITQVALAFAADHTGLAGAGCDDTSCVARRLEDALRAAPLQSAASPCARIPDRVFCCG